MRDASATVRAQVTTPAQKTSANACSAGIARRNDEVVGDHLHRERLTVGGQDARPHGGDDLDVGMLALGWTMMTLMVFGVLPS